ncbi:MAG TPA: hypothetical protein PLN78_04850 [Pseudomonadales bacterium]|nr:hypothetical protein [Pseudomonadales bacterium]HND14286.1 hypothetical protein [Pseudomonadales bacterium]
MRQRDPIDDFLHLPSLQLFAREQRHQYQGSYQQLNEQERVRIRCQLPAVDAFLNEGFHFATQREPVFPQQIRHVGAFADDGVSEHDALHRFGSVCSKVLANRMQITDEIACSPELELSVLFTHRLAQQVRLCRPAPIHGRVMHACALCHVDMVEFQTMIPDRVEHSRNYRPSDDFIASAWTLPRLLRHCYSLLRGRITTIGISRPKVPARS